MNDPQSVNLTESDREVTLVLAAFHRFLAVWYLQHYSFGYNWKDTLQQAYWIIFFNYCLILIMFVVLQLQYE